VGGGGAIAQLDTTSILLSIRQPSSGTEHAFDEECVFAYQLCFFRRRICGKIGVGGLSEALKYEEASEL